MLMTFLLCPNTYYYRFSNFHPPFFPGSPMGRTYYDDFHRYGGKGSSRRYRGYLPPRETPKEREARKAREREQHEREGRRSFDRTERHDQSRGDDDSRKRKHDESRHKSHEAEDPSKRSKVAHQSASDQLSSSKPIDIPSDAPALQKTDIQKIFKRPAYTIPRGPPKLESQFPKWCLWGVRFDLDLVPIDKDTMLKNLDAVKQDIERMHN